MKKLIMLLALVLLQACASQPAKNDQLAQTVTEYFEVYSERTDFERLMTFYAETAKLDDIVYGFAAKNKADIRAFLNWHNGEFKRLGGDKILTITEQTIKDNSVITQGYFHQFSYNKKQMGPWLFIIYQEFDNELKIIKQTDWINYTPKADFVGGLNMNRVLSTEPMQAKK